MHSSASIVKDKQLNNCSSAITVMNCSSNDDPVVVFVVLPATTAAVLLSNGVAHTLSRLLTGW